MIYLYRSLATYQREMNFETNKELEVTDPSKLY